MDGYYQNQAQTPYYQGAARQRGRGLGSAALVVGRAAIPLFKNFILPTAKRLGKTALEFAIPELLDIVSGETKPKAALKRVARKTIKAQVGGGRPRKPRKRIIQKTNTVGNSRPRKERDIFKNIKE